MSDSEGDLDEVDFEDESFSNQLRVAAAGGGNQQTSGTGTSPIHNKASVETITYLNADILYPDTEKKQQIRDLFIRERKTQTESLQVDASCQKNFGYDRPEDDSDAGYEVAGLDKWLKKIEPKIIQLLEANVENNLFANYEPDLDDDNTGEEIKIVHRLSNPYDFAEANKAIQGNIKKQREADKERDQKKGITTPTQASSNNYDDDDGFDDEFDDGFNDGFNDY